MNGPLGPGMCWYINAVNPNSLQHKTEIGAEGSITVQAFQVVPAECLSRIEVRISRKMIIQQPQND